MADIKLITNDGKRAMQCCDDTWNNIQSLQADARIKSTKPRVEWMLKKEYDADKGTTKKATK